MTVFDSIFNSISVTRSVFGKPQLTQISLHLARSIPWTYSDTFPQILSVKNDSNSIFLQFRVFVCGPIPKNENAESAEGFKKFIKFTESVLDSGCTAQIDHLLPMLIYAADYFSNLLLSI